MLLNYASNAYFITPLSASSKEINGCNRKKAAFALSNDVWVYSFTVLKMDMAIAHFAACIVQSDAWYI